MKNCPICNKEMPDSVKYCSKECIEKAKAKLMTGEPNNIITDLNVKLIIEAIRTETEIRITPRRSYTIKGIPIKLENSTLRIYVNTGENIESVLISEVGHFCFPIKLMKSLENATQKQDS